MDFKDLTFKDFENIPLLDINKRSDIFAEYLKMVRYDDHQSYRVISKSGCSSKMTLESIYGDSFISYV